LSDGKQTLRCALNPHGVTVHVSDFYGGSGGPNQWSVDGFHYGSGMSLKTGAVVKGKVRLELLGKQK
jgi:hypothetical protein